MARARKSNIRRSAEGKSSGGRVLNIKRLVIVAAALVVAAYFVYFIVWQQVTIKSKNSEIETLERLVAEEQEESARLQREVDSMNDPEYIERVARERLGLVRPNERVFVDSNKSDDNAN